MKTSIKKRALAVVAGPYRLYQILWLYTQYSSYEWNILLLPYGKGNEQNDKLFQICNELGVFKNVYRAKMTGEMSSLKEKIILFTQMLFFFLIGRKKAFMKKIILEQTDKNDFEVAFVGCEYSVIEGAIIGLAEEKEVYIFEEGLSDYCERKKFPSFKINELTSFVLSKMGYCNPYGYFELQNTWLCEKYASLPNNLRYRHYRKIRTLFEGNEESRQQFKRILNKAYPVKNISLDKYDVILLTNPMSDHVGDSRDYIERLHRWLQKEYAGKKILIKKHPRDRESYIWSDLDCGFLNAEIPAELFVELITEQKIILMSVSTILISLLQKKADVSIVQFSDIHDEYEKKLLPLLDVFNFDRNHIAYL